MIFVDEFGYHLGMTRGYARAPRSERAYGAAPCKTNPKLTLVLGLGLRGVVAPFGFEGARNGHVFASYVSSCLAPVLRKGDIVVVDGLSAHRSEPARQAVRNQGAQLWILPPYSPDLSPVEECGAKLKHHVRSQEPRTVSALIDALGEAIGKVSWKDAWGWFTHRAEYLWNCPKTRTAPL